MTMAATPQQKPSRSELDIWGFQQNQEDSVVQLPYGDPTWAIVDEREGGIVAYANSEERARIIIDALTRSTTR